MSESKYNARQKRPVKRLKKEEKVETRPIRRIPSIWDRVDRRMAVEQFSEIADLKSLCNLSAANWSLQQWLGPLIRKETGFQFGYWIWNKANEESDSQTFCVDVLFRMEDDVAELLLAAASFQCILCESVKPVLVDLLQILDLLQTTSRPPRPALTAMISTNRFIEFVRAKVVAVDEWQPSERRLNKSTPWYNERVGGMGKLTNYSWTDKKMLEIIRDRLGQLHKYIPKQLPVLAKVVEDNSAIDPFYAASFLWLTRDADPAPELREDQYFAFTCHGSHWWSRLMQLLDPHARGYILHQHYHLLCWIVIEDLLGKFLHEMRFVPLLRPGEFQLPPRPSVSETQQPEYDHPASPRLVLRKDIHYVMTDLS